MLSDSHVNFNDKINIIDSRFLIEKIDETDLTTEST